MTLRANDIVIDAVRDVICRVMHVWQDETVTVVGDAEWPIQMRVPLDDLSFVAHGEASLTFN